MQGHPVKAYGAGGRQYHTDRGGNIYDHFSVEFEYENGIRMNSMCRQIQGTDNKVGEEIVGTKGFASLVGRKAQFTGENARVFREYSNNLLKRFGIAVGSPAKMQEFAKSRQSSSLRGISIARIMFVGIDKAA